MPDPKLNGAISREIARALFDRLSDAQRDELEAATSLHDLRLRLRALAANNPNIRGFDEMLELLERADGAIHDNLLTTQNTTSILAAWMAGDIDEVRARLGLLRPRAPRKGADPRETQDALKVVKLK